MLRDLQQPDGRFLREELCQLSSSLLVFSSALLFSASNVDLVSVGPADRPRGTLIGSRSTARRLRHPPRAGVFVNPHGYVHDIIVLRSARSRLLVEGRPSEDACW